MHKNYVDHPLVRAADAFAEYAHRNQVRKYTGEPYIVHPREVMQIVSTVVHTPWQLAAALLHDVVEDTGVTMTTILKNFGPEVSYLVGDLTDISQPEDGNRAARKARDCQHTAQAAPMAKTVKLADLISNTQSITLHDPMFARVYMPEKRALLKVLTEGDPVLYKRAELLVNAYFNSVQQPS